jgi:hypothetical protein
MGEEDLEVLITMDDPGEDALEVDTFHQPGQPRPSKRPSDQANEVIDNDPS